MAYKGRPIRLIPDFSLETLIQKGLDRYSMNFKKSQMPAQPTIPSKTIKHNRQRRKNIPQWNQI